MFAETNVSVHCVELRLSSSFCPGLSPPSHPRILPSPFEGLTTAREEE